LNFQMCGENTNIMTMPDTTDNYAHVDIIIYAQLRPLP
jgi:hypothetical protein